VQADEHIPLDTVEIQHRVMSEGCDHRPPNIATSLAFLWDELSGS
jgi:hypothetical protein